MQLTDSVEQRFRQGLGDAATAPLGLAVSGGGDSVALLHLAVGAGCPVAVATVDHGLRAEAAEEAAMVARSCAALGVPHETLHWRWDGRGNLPDAARRGRTALLAGWAKARGLSAVALGHTRDDVAETLLMRLDRDAGVDGLAAMSARREVQGVAFIRPLLAVGRGELRDWLSARGIDWADDPTNTDMRYTRARTRARLAEQGGAEGLAALAQGWRLLRDALEAQAARFVRHAVRIDRGDVLVDRAAFADAPEETRRRVVLAALRWLASADYGPRGPALSRFLASLTEGRPSALAGCRALIQGPTLRLTREARSVATSETPLGSLWDGRWHVEGPEIKDLTVRFTGEDGLRLCPDWRATGIPRAALIAAPAVWRGGDLVAAPLAGKGAGWRARVVPPDGLLANAALSH